MRFEEEWPGHPDNGGLAEYAEAVNLSVYHSTHSLHLHLDRWAMVTRLAYRIAHTPPRRKITAVRCGAAANVTAWGVEVRT